MTLPSEATHIPAYATTEPGAIVFITEPTDGYTYEEIYELFGPGPQVTDDGEYVIDEEALTAAIAEEPVHTGAMIALVPSMDDAKRVYLGDGEPIDELHLTLMYLGEAADISSDARQSIIDQLTAAVDAGLPPVVGEVFGISVFNPTGDEPCVVLMVGGEDLEQFHDQALFTANTAAIDTSESKRPWVAHVTLAYTDVPSLPVTALAEDRMGPMTFDRIRVAFGDEVTDIPLGA